MYIYRIENDMNSGPFGYGHMDNIERYYGSFTHPTGANDEIQYMYVDGFEWGRFGCADWESLKHWFVCDEKMLAYYNMRIPAYMLVSVDAIEGINDRTLRKLKDNNFVINVYRINKKYVKVGRTQKQVVFALDRATKITSIPVDELYKDEQGPMQFMNR